VIAWAWLLCARLLLRGAAVFFAEQPFELVQTFGPEALVKAQPLMGAGERSGIEAAEMRAAAHLAAEQPGVLQHLDVLRSGRERDGERFGKLADGALAAGEIAKHVPARGVAEGVEDGVQLGSL
jgi:hypothetical protein